MKSMIVTLMLSLIICSVAEAQKKSDRELEGLKGPVHKVTEETVRLYETEGKWVEQEKGSVAIIDSVTTTIYDAAGKRMEFINYFPDDLDSGKIKLLYRCVFSYDAKGRRTRKVFIDPSAEPPGEGSIPKEEMPPAAVRTRDGATLTTLVEKFDAFGNPAETITYNGTAKGVMVQRDTYNYNAQTRTMETLTYDFRNRLVEKIIDKLDEQNNEVESLFSNFNMITKEVIHRKLIYSDYEFDVKGNWIKRSELTSGINENDPRPIEKSIIKRKITYH